MNQAFVSPDETGHTRHFEMAKFLQAHGHELVIVASDLNYQTGRRTVERSGLFAEQNIEGVRVLRSYIYPALHRSYFWRVISFFSFMFSSIWTAFQVRDVDLVMGTTPPIFQAVSAWFVAWMRRAPFLLEVRDLWPEFGVGMGVLKNPVVISSARRLEKFLYARATHILVNSPAYRDYMIGNSSIFSSSRSACSDSNSVTGCISKFWQKVRESGHEDKEGSPDEGNERSEESANDGQAGEGSG